MFYILSKEEAFELIQKTQVAETLQEGIHRAKFLSDENKTEYVLLQELSKIDLHFKEPDFYIDSHFKKPSVLTVSSGFLDQNNQYVILKEWKDPRDKKLKTLADPNNTPYEIVKENDFLDPEYRERLELNEFKLKKIRERRSIIAEVKEDINKIFDKENDFDKFLLKIEVLLWTEQKYQGKFGVALYKNKYSDNGFYSAIRIKTFSGVTEQVFYTDVRSFNLAKKQINKELDLDCTISTCLEFLPNDYKPIKNYTNEEIKKLCKYALDNSNSFHLFLSVLSVFYEHKIENKKIISLNKLFDLENKIKAISFYDEMYKKIIFIITKDEFEQYKKDKETEDEHQSQCFTYNETKTIMVDECAKINMVKECLDKERINLQKSSNE